MGYHILESDHYQKDISALAPDSYDSPARRSKPVAIQTQGATSYVQDLATHCFDQFKVIVPEIATPTLLGAYFDIHYFTNIRMESMFPLLIGMVEDRTDYPQVDIYSIDDKGLVLAHTNMIGKPSVVTKDNSIDRLKPYAEAILERAQRYPMRMMMRIERALP